MTARMRKLKKGETLAGLDVFNLCLNKAALLSAAFLYFKSMPPK